MLSENRNSNEISWLDCIQSFILILMKYDFTYILTKVYTNLNHKQLNKNQLISTEDNNDDKVTASQPSMNFQIKVIWLVVTLSCCYIILMFTVCVTNQQLSMMDVFIDVVSCMCSAENTLALLVSYVKPKGSNKLIRFASVEHYQWLGCPCSV